MKMGHCHSMGHKNREPHHRAQKWGAVPCKNGEGLASIMYALVPSSLHHMHAHGPVRVHLKCFLFPFPPVHQLKKVGDLCPKSWPYSWTGNACLFRHNTDTKEEPQCINLNSFLLCFNLNLFFPVQTLTVSRRQVRTGSSSWDKVVQYSTIHYSIVYQHIGWLPQWFHINVTKQGGEVHLNEGLWDNLSFSTTTDRNHSQVKSRTTTKQFSKPPNTAGGAEDAMINSIKTDQKCSNE